ncbi:MAG TPA: hypothetical protein VNK04_15885 [Gemmataceae bacterium]|nr:hypothetical protein [Gemmataceae bacterium]
MAAKGESKQGLIITLVFFVLLSILLGVVAYFGYAEQDHLANEKKKADAEKKTAETDRDYYRFQSLLCRAYMGHLLAKDMEELGVLMDRFAPVQDVQGRKVRQLKADIKSKDRDDIVKMLAELEKELGGIQGTKPETTYRETLARKNQEIDALKSQLKGESDKLAKASEELKKKSDELEMLKKDYAAKLAEQKDTSVADLKKYVDNIAQLQEEIKGLGARREELQENIAALDEKYQKLLKRKERDIADLEQRAQKAEAKIKPPDYLEFDQPKGRIVEIDRGGQMPFIDLGRAHNLKPGLTFSIHAVGPGGKPVREPKGSLEVVEILGDRLAQAKITWLRDEKRDPVVRGDLLFNPAWSPNLKQRIAVAGIIDLTGEPGLRRNPNLAMRSMLEFIRTLENQGVVVDAYLDLRDNTIKGQITRLTEFLVLGELPELDLTTPLKEDEPRAQRAETTISQMTKMQQEAIANGVTIISLPKFLNLTGYRVPRPVYGNKENYNFRPTTVPGPSPLDRIPLPPPPADKGPRDSDKLPLPGAGKDKTGR